MAEKLLISTLTGRCPMLQPPGCGAVTRRARARTGPVVRNDARIVRARSIGTLVFRCDATGARTVTRWLAQSRWTRQPSWRRISAMLRTSSTSGTLSMTHSSVVKSVAAMMGNAAFLAPLVATSPRSGTCPSIINLSMALPCRVPQRWSAWNLRSLTPSGDLQSHLRSSQGRFGDGEIGRRASLLQEQSRALLGGTRAFDVDFFRPFGRVGEHQHAIVADFQEATARGKIVIVGTLPLPKRARLQGRDQGGVARQ